MIQTHRPSLWAILLLPLFSAVSQDSTSCTSLVSPRIGILPWDRKQQQANELTNAIHQSAIFGLGEILLVAGHRLNLSIHIISRCSNNLNNQDVHSIIDTTILVNRLHALRFVPTLFWLLSLQIGHYSWQAVSLSIDKDCWWWNPKVLIWFAHFLLRLPNARLYRACQNSSMEYWLSYLSWLVWLVSSKSIHWQPSPFIKYGWAFPFMTTQSFPCSRLHQRRIDLLNPRTIARVNHEIRWTHNQAPTTAIIFINCVKWLLERHPYPCNLQVVEIHDGINTIIVHLMKCVLYRASIICSGL